MELRWPRGIKRVVRAAATVPAVTRWFRPLKRGVATILVLHRFGSGGGRAPGHAEATLRESLRLLRRAGVMVLPLADLLDRLADPGRRVDGEVAFTVDDGYVDFCNVAAPVFESFGLPVTLFLTTGYLDGTHWLWWDQLEWALDHSPRRDLTIDLGAGVRTWRWTDLAARTAVWHDLFWGVRPLTEDARRRAVEAVACALEVAIPGRAPAEYAAMTWDQARTLAARGNYTFGPHSITHPLLAGTTDAQARDEIAGSWARCRQELPGDRVLPVFCYPDGRDGAFTARDEALVRDAGYRAAVLGCGAYVSQRALAGEGGGAWFRLPRFPFPQSAAEVAQIVSGIERLKRFIRRE